MSKYIDADRLIGYIEKLKIIFEKILAIDNSRKEFFRGKKEMANQTIGLITSLKQKQSDTDRDDGKFVKILVRKEYAELLQKLGDEIQSGQFSFIGAMNQQEQPEIDLEKEIINYFQGLWPGIETPEQCNTDMHFTPSAIMRLARYFYELGYNARKEETK